MDTRRENERRAAEAAERRNERAAAQSDRPQPNEADSAASKAKEASDAAAEAARVAEAERVKARDDKSQASTETSLDRDAANDPNTPKKITVTFTGDPRGGADPEKPEYAGKVFPKNQGVVIEDQSWIRTYAAGLRQNNHFKVE